MSTSLPFICGKGQEVTCVPFLECAMKEEEMTIEHMLVLFITTPKELNGGGRTIEVMLRK